MNGFQSSPADCPAGSVCSIEGLPPLPKGLSGILNSSGGSWRDIEKVYSKRTRIQADISKSRVSDCLGRSKPASLDAALAVLRKEMDISSSLCESSFNTENGYSEDEDEEDVDENEGESGETLLSLPQPTQNSRDQWIKDSFHIPI
ncbi:Protein FAM89B [Anabarilius grahami]|uniref:Protein FAM89B n=1 Tax=Anabarilius grahami TaxID=495550 RepID=A0A3N0Z7S2_ANAGA|nr:Protein FAM89B [Anabarilius grahami]